MNIILHLTELTNWEEAKQQGSYQHSSLIKEGFIHCSTIKQIKKVAEAFFQGKTNLVLLHIEVAKLTSPLQWEPPAHLSTINLPDLPPQELFPHIYGPINLEAVIKVEPWI